MNELKVTDGTTTVNLVNLEEGFSVSDWIQAVAQYKDGGTWQQSALTDEARLVAKAFDNTVEEIPIPAVSAGRENVAAAALATLMMLLEKASDYWTDDWRDEPVWLESLAEGETNKQYSIIYMGGFPDIGDPYSHAYLESAALAGLTLRLVRGHWTENEPKVGTALPISARETFDSRWFGNVDDTGTRETTTAAEVYTVNKRLECNITHAYRVTNAGAWTDLVAAGPDFALFPAAGHAAGDFLVVGIECGGNNHYLFSNLIFDILIANTDLDTIWEYWDGAAPWGALSPYDNTDATPAVGTDAFTATGVNGVWWTQPSDWVRDDLNTIEGGAAPAVTGYWVRCRVTVVGGAPVSPIQQDRDIYACQWPYIEVQAADIGGHISAVCKLLSECRSGSTITQLREVKKITGGLRSVDRGATFVAFINLAESAAGTGQNPAGIDVDILDAVDTSYQSSTEYPAYYYIRYAPAADRNLSDEFDVSIDNDDFHGAFRAFLRVKQVGGTAGDIGVMVRHQVENQITKQSPTQYTRDVNEPHLIDLGEFTIPGISPFEGDVESQFIFFLSNSNAPTADLYCFDFVLIPIDEFVFNTSSDETSNTGYLRVGRQLEIDSIIDPKHLIRAIVEYTATGYLVSIWPVIAGDRLPFHPNERQRYWFVSEAWEASPDTWLSRLYAGMRHQMQAVQRYLGRRGSD